MGKGDTARLSYECARAEIVERIRLRDSALVLFLGAVSAVFTIALGQLSKWEVLLIVPYLSVGASAIVTQHHSIIGAQLSFITADLELFFKTIGEDAPLWENSKIRFLISKKDITFRFLAHLTLIATPAIVALILTWRAGLSQILPISISWWTGAITTVVSCWFILESHIFRNRLRRTIAWRLTDNAFDPVSEEPSLNTTEGIVSPDKGEIEKKQRVLKGPGRKTNANGGRQNKI